MIVTFAASMGRPRHAAMARAAQSICKPKTISRSPPNVQAISSVTRLAATHSRTCAHHGAVAASVTGVTQQMQTAAYLAPDTPMRRQTPALGDVP
jgi:hypothetical protein